MLTEPSTKPNFCALLECPTTKTELLSVNGSALQSKDGTTAYQVRDGVPNFLSSQAWETSDAEHLADLLRIARDEGCLEAIESVIGDSGYVTDLSRAIYLDLLPVSNDSVVLEIGASLGQHTREIATRCKHVESLEVIPEQALFAKLRCDQDNLSNVNVSIGGEQCQLPYKAGVFDVVIMNYVLEWSAGRSKLHPRQCHEMLIAECNRVLRPGGVLFLATKNRYSLRLLRGGIDEHVDFRFGNALPRWLMNAVSKLKPPSRSPGYLHSYGALHSIIERSGFDIIDPLLALPDARYPRIYSSFSQEALSELRTDERMLSLNRSTRFLLKYVPNGWIKWISPSLVYMAQKQ